MKKILIVDDEDIIRALVHATLEREEIRIFEASDGEDAWEIICEDQPDLVLLDIGLPDVDGFELCNRTRACPELDSVRIVMLTAYGSPEDRQRGLEAGADGYFAKPFSPVQLLDRVRDIFATVFSDSAAMS